MELVANFTLNNESLDAQFDVSQVENFDALFEINATPEKVSQLENDLNYQTETQVLENVTKATSTYIHEQAIASDTWVIEHNLEKYPSVTVVDSAGTQFLAEVEYNSMNKITVRMGGATKGIAYLN